MSWYTVDHRYRAEYVGTHRLRGVRYGGTHSSVVARGRFSGIAFSLRPPQSTMVPEQRQEEGHSSSAVHWSVCSEPGPSEPGDRGQGQVRSDQVRSAVHWSVCSEPGPSEPEGRGLGQVMVRVRSGQCSDRTKGTRLLPCTGPCAPTQDRQNLRIRGHVSSETGEGLSQVSVRVRVRVRVRAGYDSDVYKFINIVIIVIQP